MMPPHPPSHGAGGPGPIPGGGKGQGNQGPGVPPPGGTSQLRGNAQPSALSSQQAPPSSAAVAAASIAPSPAGPRGVPASLGGLRGSGPGTGAGPKTPLSHFLQQQQQQQQQMQAGLSGPSVGGQPPSQQQQKQRGAPHPPPPNRQSSAAAAVAAAAAGLIGGSPGASIPGAASASMNKRMGAGPQSGANSGGGGPTTGGPGGSLQPSAPSIGGPPGSNPGLPAGAAGSAAAGMFRGANLPGGPAGGPPNPRGGGRGGAGQKGVTAAGAAAGSGGPSPLPGGGWRPGSAGGGGVANAPSGGPMNKRNVGGPQNNPRGGAGNNPQLGVGGPGAHPHLQQQHSQQQQQQQQQQQGQGPAQRGNPNNPPSAAGGPPPSRLGMQPQQQGGRQTTAQQRMVSGGAGSVGAGSGAGPPQHPPPSSKYHRAGGVPPHQQQPAGPQPPRPPSTSGPPQSSSTPSGGGGGMRELKVEDALLYLDEVKREFGDRPRIYNEFLEIMKNFKAQEIDTPGVIARVSHLFRGYNNLILGFNTFLPEGYKIELKDLVDNDQQEQQQQQRPPSAGLGGTAGGAPGASVATGRDVPGVRGQQEGPGQVPSRPMYFPGHKQAGPGSLGRGQPPHQQQGPPPGSAGRGAGGPHPPHMQHVHPGQQQQPPQKGPPGHPSLMGPGAKSERGQEGPPHLQGQQSLPPHQLTPHTTGAPQPGVAAPTPRGTVPPSYQGRGVPAGAPPPGAPGTIARQGSASKQTPGGALPSQQQGPPGVMQHPQQHQVGPPHQQSGHPPPPHMQQQGPKAPSSGGATQQQRGPQQQQQPSSMQPQQQPSQGQPHQAVEFDHAINYVTTIKKRFANDPQTYQTFLEILHTYQKEQRGIKEVLEQVAELFADHPDLLREFTFFLPDAVQEQAKERLHLAAANSERRQAEAAAAAAAKGGGAPAPGPPFVEQMRPGRMPPPFVHQHGVPPGQRQAPYISREDQPLQAKSGPPNETAKQRSMTGAKSLKHQAPQQPPDSSIQHAQGEFARQQIPGGGMRVALPHEQQQAHVGRMGGILPSQLQQQPPGPVQPPPPPPPGQKFIDMTKPHQLSSPGSGFQQPSTAVHNDSSPVPNRKRPYSPSGREVAPAPIVGSAIIHHPPQPETFVYNAGVERQFFDAAKEALTAFSRDGGQAWAEFLKCIDMYAQEVLSRSEMLGLVEPLLGKRNAELFEEFKRILAAAGAPNAPTYDDAWHSVPLSEIDFSRCRKCSPSYRALPRDYPAPPCSERTEIDSKVLNDVWVSLPVGSEESYTFRHMRKNQHEEVLFRCEDERFEIDMVIDTNAATLRRLEPIAEEIAVLQQKELYTANLTSNGNSSVDRDNAYSGKKGKEKSSSSGFRPCPPWAGLAGKIHQYSLDTRVLGIIHKHAIARIYGDAGQEMVDLLFKNPTMAVPIVVNRLRQKDREWRAAREFLNLRWKELAEINYYKSLDHRSLTWRTTDKRATSTRTLVAEIKDRAAHGGNEGETALSIRREKAKEEHGSFYEVTMGRSLSRKMDLTNLPKPTKTLFTPHLSLMYKNNSWAQRDAYRIITFALERGAISPGDKERCHRLWRDFLGPLFGLGLNWMQSPAVSFSSSPSVSSPMIVSNGEESGNDDDDDDESSTEEHEIGGKNVVTEEPMKQRKRGGDDMDEEGHESTFLLDHQPIPPGSQVSTLYGEGTVIKYRRSDRIYVVSFPFGGTGYLRPNAVLCTLLTVEKSSLTEELRESDKETLERCDDMLAIGTQSLYLFFRLHQVLIRRLNIAKDLAYRVGNDETLSTLVEQMTADGETDVGRKRYDAFLSLVYALVDSGNSSAQGSSASAAEGGKYEDRVRCLLGHGAYELATMDKLVSHILKNLQNMGNDDTLQNMVQLFRRHIEDGSFKPSAFRQEAAYLSEGENMFAFQYCKIPNSDRSVMHIEFLGCIAESEEEEEESSMLDEVGKKVNSSDVVMADAEESGEAPHSKRQRRLT